MHFVVAQLTDPQFNKLDQAAIPYMEIPQPLVDRFKALVPQGMAPEEALVRVMKIAILNGEIQMYDNTEGAAKDQRVRDRRAQLLTELGL